jgi:cytochrome c-type biogenesis protein CcmF
MTGQLGHLATLAAFLLSLAGLVLGIAAGATRRSVIQTYARNTAIAVFALASFANLLMVYALVTRDFSISYVAQVGSRSTPLFYTVVSLWSSLDGSLLFWGWILAAYTFSVVIVYRRSYRALMPYVIATMLGVSAFFWFLVTWPANPFASVFPVPVDGPGPNPLLQNHPFMGLHPPLLYLGYVGMTVPFAFAIAALISGKLGDEWIRASRRWTVAAWAFLGWGIIGGGWWSYEVLGWGGVWAWDPVENASLMPWLTATAFLHSVMVQERRQTMKTWNIALVVTTFALTLLGTFLTRSGILGSVHAFSEGLIGPLFLGFIAVVLLVALALVGWRSDRLKAPGMLDSLLSRETAFLINNLLLTAFTFTVLLGTLFPLIIEIVRGVQVSVGAPYYNEMGLPLLLALIFLMGVGPALTWRRTSTDRFNRKLFATTGAAVLGAGVGWLAGARGVYSIGALALIAFALAHTLTEFWIPARARMRARGDGPVGSLRAIFRQNPRRYGGYIVHIGVLVIAVGITAFSSLQTKTEVTLRPGEAVRIGSYELRLDSIYAGRQPHRDFVVAGLSAFKGASLVAELRPRLNYYPTSQQPIGTPAVHTGVLRDFYISLRAYERDGSSATVEVMLNPMIVWIWIGGFVVALGVLIVLRPKRNAERSLDKDHGKVLQETGAAALVDSAGDRTLQEETIS